MDKRKRRLNLLQLIFVALLFAILMGSVLATILNALKPGMSNAVF